MLYIHAWNMCFTPDSWNLVNCMPEVHMADIQTRMAYLARLSLCLVCAASSLVSMAVGVMSGRFLYIFILTGLAVGVVVAAGFSYSADSWHWYEIVLYTGGLVTFLSTMGSDFHKALVQHENPMGWNLQFTCGKPALGCSRAVGGNSVCYYCISLIVAVVLYFAVQSALERSRWSAVLSITYRDANTVNQYDCLSSLSYEQKHF